MRIIVNGEAFEVPEGTSLERLLTLRGHDTGRRGMAIALNGEVVPRGRWTRQAVMAGDHLELLTASQGG